jgi:Type II secretion system (T2SS), protein G
MTVTGAQNKKIRKFYYLSLLCLIPGFGIIGGIILSCYAIFKFKSIKLFLTVVLATVGGIFLVKLDNYYLEQKIMYGKEFENFAVQEVANDLELISKNLEHYKLKYGDYPDSLQQLKDENPFLSIKDPLLTRNKQAHKFIFYYYQKANDGYSLFSSGRDGIPNTSDDIYPRTHLK